MNALRKAVDTIFKRNDEGYPIPTEDLEMAKPQQIPPSIEMTDAAGHPQTAEVDLTDSEGAIRKSSLSAAFEEEDENEGGPFSGREFKNPLEALFPNFQWPCGMTNFHVSLIVGVIGFFIFWLGLLLRIYLPHDYFSS